MLVAIENIKIGDWVLSQPEKTGEQAYKRVVRTTHFEDKSVAPIRCYSSADGVEQVQTFTAIGNHPFYVKGHDTTDVGGRAADDAKKPTGWTRADLLEYGAMLELADGRLITVTAVDPVWRTKTEGVGWIGDRDAEVGHYIDLRNGQVQESFGGLNNADLAGVDDFNERYEDEELTEKWVYKCAVYNFEVEDFHTYYVGDLGVWVHNTNCFEESLKPMKRQGKLTSPDLEVYFSVSDVNALVATMDKPKGMVLVYEKIVKEESPWVIFQHGVEGGFSAKDGSYFLARTLLYKNPVAGGSNLIKLGDGAAYIRTGKTPVLSKTTIDAKSWESWKSLLSKDAGVVAGVQNKVLKRFASHRKE